MDHSHLTLNSFARTDGWKDGHEQNYVPPPLVGDKNLDVPNKTDLDFFLDGFRREKPISHQNFLRLLLGVILEKKEKKFLSQINAE